MITVVFPYISDFAEGDELKYAIRSIQTHLKTKFRICVIGDLPSYLDSNEIIHIPVNRFSEGLFKKWFDQLNKLQTAIESKSVSEQFIWMYDDTYLIDDVTYNDLLKPKAEFPYFSDNAKNAGPLWQHVHTQTCEKLKHYTIQVFNYETHLPRVYDKSLLLYLIEKFSLHKNPYAIATLYYNYYFPDTYPDDVKNYRAKITEPASMYDIITATDKKKFLNHKNKCFNDSMKGYLENTFPEPSIY
ncbi:MAG: hypothetical protein K9J21_11875 [Bacteroidales bacterium]|nr:hypothetical protein [Bacteroidales bacterium]